MAVRKQKDPKWQQAGKKAAETRRRNLALRKHDRTKPKQEVKPEEVTEERPEHERGDEAAIHASSVFKMETTTNFDLRHYMKPTNPSGAIEKPWVTKYRPASLDGCVGAVIDYFKAYVKTGSIPLGFVLHGFFGQGKTTVARCFIRDFYVARGIFKRDSTFEQIASAANTTRDYQGIFPPVLFLNASQFRAGNHGVITDDVVTRVRNFMKYSAGNTTKFLVVDEADLFGFAVQDAISSSIEKHDKTRVIWITNYINDIRDRIVSRCAGGVFEFKKPDDMEMMGYLKNICVEEHVKMPDAKLMETIKRAPCVRDAVGMLQREAVLVMSQKVMKNGKKK